MASLHISQLFVSAIKRSFHWDLECRREKNDRAIFKEYQMKAIPEYIVLALPRSIIGLKEQTLPTEPQLP